MWPICEIIAQIWPLRSASSLMAPTLCMSAPSSMAPTYLRRQFRFAPTCRSIWVQKWLGADLYKFSVIFVGADLRGQICKKFHREARCDISLAKGPNLAKNTHGSSTSSVSWSARTSTVVCTQIVKEQVMVWCLILFSSHWYILLLYFKPPFAFGYMFTVPKG